MKHKRILTCAAVALLPLTAFTQPSPPAPPAPPSPPSNPGAPNNPPPKHDKMPMPKVPVTFLGVETSEVPRVVSEQLGLAKGFGLVVDYVVADGPAAAAGLQQNDILKMLNDQILVDPGQLSKLIRSYSEGTTITLTVLRKGQEQKFSVKLTKKDVPQGRDWHDMKHMGDMDFGQFDQLRDQLGEEKANMIQQAVMTAQEQAERAREEGQRAGEKAREAAQQVAERAREQAQRMREQAQEMREQQREQAQRQRDQAQRVRDQTRRGGEISITHSDDNGMKTTRIDLRKAQIVFSDEKGELRIDNASGKKLLTAKDPQGRLLFSGPVETPDEVEKVPADVRERFQKLQNQDLPSVLSEKKAEEDQDADDADQDEDDSSDDDQGDDNASLMQQVSAQVFPAGLWNFRTAVI